MSSCNCIIMIFSFLIETYAAIQPELVSCLATQSHFVYTLQPNSLFLPGGDFPPSVAILHVCPCIEHRYVPLLGTSLFSLMTLVSSQYVTIKPFYSFSRFSKYLKKSKKNQKTKNTDKKRCYLWQQSSRVAFEQSTVYHIHQLGLQFDFRSYTHFI